jgi:hypothetical protein
MASKAHPKWTTGATGRQESRCTPTHRRPTWAARPPAGAQPQLSFHDSSDFSWQRPSGSAAPERDQAHSNPRRPEKKERLRERSIEPFEIAHRFVECAAPRRFVFRSKESRFEPRPFVTRFDARLALAGMYQTTGPTLPRRLDGTALVPGHFGDEPAGTFLGSFAGAPRIPAIPGAGEERLQTPMLGTPGWQ